MDNYTGTFGLAIERFRSGLATLASVGLLLGTTTIIEAMQRIHLQYAEDPVAPYILVTQSSGAAASMSSCGPTFTPSGSVIMEFVWEKESDVSTSEAYVDFFNKVEAITAELLNTTLLINSYEFVAGPGCGDPNSEYKDIFTARVQYSWGLQE